MFHVKHFGPIDELRKSIFARQDTVLNRDFAQAHK